MASKINGVAAHDVDDLHTLRASEKRKTIPELTVESVVFGDRLIRPSHSGKYRSDIVGSSTSIERLYVCSSCFKYSVDVVQYLSHWRRCQEGGIPGEKIYESGTHSLYEVDGKDLWLFAQNISLFAKLFIEQKTVCFDVSGFLFYLLVQSTQGTDPADQIIGFFSKEKLSWDLNNLACIVVFPPWQKQGLGQLLMAASYAISKREGKIGGPEKPLSDMGQQSYNVYWSRAIARAILEHPPDRALTVQDISEQTFIIVDDVVATLKLMGILGRTRMDSSFAIGKDKVRTWLAAEGVDGPDLLDPAGFVHG